MKLDTFCQSCMMPHDKDPGMGGTNQNGSRNKDYCSFCYKDGEFIWDDASMDEIKEISVREMRKSGYPLWLAKFMLMPMKNLKRWKK